MCWGWRGKRPACAAREIFDFPLLPFYFLSFPFLTISAAFSSLLEATLNSEICGEQLILLEQG
jgi:hypothetical protein